jgi:hypothetical protein
MDESELVESVKKIDLRLEGIEQFLPTLATKDELRAQALAIKDELRAQAPASKEDLRAAVALLATKEELRAAVAPLATGHLHRIAFNHSSEDAMNFLPSVIRPEYGGGYRIRLTFNDDLQKTIDFAQWLDGPVFEPLKDPACFSTFFLNGGTIAWPNGADVAPETLYGHQGVAGEAA